MENIQFTGRKVFSYETENLTSQLDTDTDTINNFEQSLFFSMKGNISENLTTDLIFNDQLPSKIENMEFNYYKGPFTMTVGDFSLDKDKQQFAIPESRLRGFKANYDNESSEITIFLSSPDSRLITEIVRGNGERGPYFLSSGKLLNESEILQLRDIKLIKNIDYVIDYSSGAVEFNDPLPSGEMVDITYRVDELSNNERDTLFAFKSETSLSDNKKINLKMLRRNNKSVNHTETSHTLIAIDQEMKLSRKLGFTSSFSHMLLEKENQEQTKDNYYGFITNYSMGNVVLNLNFDKYGNKYIPIYNSLKPASKKMSVSMDLDIPGILNNIELSSIEGDELGDRKMLSGKLEYMKNEKFGITTNYRLRQPEDKTGSDYLTNIKSHYIHKGFKLENRFSYQDNLDLFQNENGINSIIDGEFRISTSPHKKILYLVEGRKMNEYLTNDNERIKSNNRVRMMYKISNKTRLNSSYSIDNIESHTGNDEKTQNMESTLTHRINKKMTLDSVVNNIKHSGFYGYDGNGLKFGLRYSPFKKLRLTSNMSLKRKNYKRFDKTLNLFDEDLRLSYQPSNKYIIEMIGRNEDTGIDQVTGLENGNRTHLGGKITCKLNKGLKLLSDVSLSSDKVPHKRERLKWNTELNVRIKKDINFYINFYKLETIFPDKKEWDTTNTKGGFRFEARI